MAFFSPCPPKESSRQSKNLITILLLLQNCYFSVFFLVLPFPCFCLFCSKDSKYSKKWLLFYQKWLFFIPVKYLCRLDQVISHMKSSFYTNLRQKLSGLFRVQISWTYLPHWPSSSPGRWSVHTPSLQTTLLNDGLENISRGCVPLWAELGAAAGNQNGMENSSPVHSLFLVPQ